MRSFIVSTGGHPKEGPSKATAGGAGTGGAGGTGAAGGAGGGAGENGGNAKYPSLLFALVWRLSHERDTGMLQHVFEILKLLLDPETMEPQQKDEFLGLFYDHYMSWVIDPLGPALAHEVETNEDDAVAAARNHLCEILAYCVVSHGYRIKVHVGVTICR